MAKRKEPTTAKTKDILPCKCRNFMPYRMQNINHKTKKISCVLGCQMCGRASEDITPFRTVKKWNKENGERKE